MKRLTILIISLALIVTFTVQCGKPGANDAKADTNSKSAKKNDPEKQKKDKDKTDAVPVQVVSPNRGDISSFLLFSSNIDSEQVVDIYPMTYGIIEKINFDEGQYVKKGDILAVLDDREAAINNKKAEINLKNLKSEFQRQEEIFEKQMLSKDEFERLKFNLETAELEWKQKKLLLSYTRITSPISGVVTKRYIKAGNRINTSQMAFSVVQDKEKIAVVNIPEQEKKAVFLKQKSVISAAGQSVQGWIKRMSPAIDPGSGTFKVTVGVKDEEGVFAVGQFVNVKIIKKVHKNTILLTKDAVVYEGGRTFIYVVGKDNQAAKKPIRIGFEEGNIVEVLEGVTPDDKVVTAGKSSLKNKTLVKIVEPVVS